MDGYHAMPTQQRFFNRYLADIGMDTASRAAPTASKGLASPLAAAMR